MNYKLLVLDLDGTLTNSKKEITPFTRETLLKAQEKGLHLVLASGAHLRYRAFSRGTEHEAIWWFYPFLQRR